MLRRTDVYLMLNTTADGARNVGFTSVRPSMREPPCGHGERDECGPFRYGQSAQGIASPCAVKYVWEPQVLSVSATVRDPDGNIAQDLTQQFLSTFVAYSVWDGARSEASAGDYLTLTTSNLQQPIGGFRAGQVGGREMYASNAGQGYRFPRQVLPGDKCSSKYHRIFALVLSHSILDDGSTGAWVIDWEWKLREL